MTPFSPFSPLARAVAQGAQPADLLPELHRHILAGSGGTASVVLQRQPSTAAYRATSGRGFNDLGGTWLAGAAARDIENRALDGPFVEPLPPGTLLADRLSAPEAMVIPLTEAGEPAFLLIGGAGFTLGRAREIGGRAAVEFGLALELARLARQRAVHQKLQELFLALSHGVSATLSFGDTLDVLAGDTNALFGTRRTSIWLHNRRARQLTLAASSDPAHREGPLPNDGDTPAARGLRLERPLIEPDGAEIVLMAPLRGWRRALGTVVVEGAPAELTDREFLEAAHELARQLSGALENVQLLEDILQQRRLLEDTFNSLTDLVVVVDNALRVVQTNEAFAARMGTPRATLLQQPLGDMIGVEIVEWITPQEPGPVNAGTRQFTDARLDAIVAATRAPLINQDGQPVGQVLVMRDITAQTRMEQEQAALRERLAQSEKLASLGQFVAGIAHEINNPLQGVLGHLELLAASEASAPFRPTLRQIHREGERAAKIVRNLLVFAGSKRMTRRAVLLDRVIARAAASRAAALRKGRITLLRPAPEGRTRILGDALLLQQAFVNIIINAEHAIAAAGQPGRIEMTVVRTGDTVRAVIRDTGTGIPAHVLPRIFDPFFTTKEVGQGTGLGLAITYGIVQDHGGTIRAENHQDGGAAFIIELPGD